MGQITERAKELKKEKEKMKQAKIQAAIEDFKAERKIVKERVEKKLADLLRMAKTEGLEWLIWPTPEAFQNHHNQQMDVLQRYMGVDFELVFYFPESDAAELGAFPDGRNGGALSGYLKFQLAAMNDSSAREPMKKWGSGFTLSVPEEDPWHWEHARDEILLYLYDYLVGPYRKYSPDEQTSTVDED